MDAKLNINCLNLVLTVSLFYFAYVILTSWKLIVTRQCGSINIIHNFKNNMFEVFIVFHP